MELHFLYLNDPEIKENWKRLQQDTAKMLAFFNKNIGPYPYKQYSVIQGGDGGMEYPMCTLITGGRKYKSLFGVTAHELAHSWFHHLLGTNESKYAWMDEGFTSYIESVCINEILDEGYYKPSNRWAYSSYFRWANSGIEEPLTTHADLLFSETISSIGVPLIETNDALAIGLNSSSTSGSILLINDSKSFLISRSILTKNRSGAIDGILSDISFNVIPQIGSFESSGYTEEEEKMINETKKIRSRKSMTPFAIELK